MMSHRFWIAWLRLATLGVIALGLSALAAAHPAGAAVWGFLIDLVRWSFDGVAISFDANARLINGVTGGALVSWGVLMSWLAAGPIARGDKGARRIALIAILAWFAADSAGSVMADVPGNVIFNLVVLVILLTPLLAMEFARTMGPTSPKP